jgi:hypothetical protein
MPPPQQNDHLQWNYRCLYIGGVTRKIKRECIGLLGGRCVF